MNECVVTRKAPLNLQKRDLYLFERELIITLPPVFIIANENVIVINGNTVIDNKNKLIPGYAQINSYPVKKLEKIKLLLKKWFYKKYIIDNSCFWITDAWSLGYFHWLSDALPRLICLKNESNKFNVLLPEFYKELKYVISSLNLLGFDPVFFDPLRPLYVKKLITCTNIAPSGNYNPSLLKKIKEILIANITIPSKPFPSKNIYISRSKAFHRKVLNEDDVIQCLTNYGFKTIISEDLTFEEQVILFNNSKNVVSIHGAGLSNCLFMKPKSNILELRMEGDSHSNCYYSMADANNVNYYYLGCDTDSDNTFDGNIRVDINRLQKTIKLMLNV